MSNSQEKINRIINRIKMYMFEYNLHNNLTICTNLEDFMNERKSSMENLINVIIPVIQKMSDIDEKIIGDDIEDVCSKIFESYMLK